MTQSQSGDFCEEKLLLNPINLLTSCVFGDSSCLFWRTGTLRPSAADDSEAKWRTCLRNSLRCCMAAPLTLMCETDRWLGGARGPGVSGCDDTLVSGKNKRDSRPGRSRAQRGQSPGQTETLPDQIQEQLGKLTGFHQPNWEEMSWDKSRK